LGVLRAFASFGFCKAHAAAFALPTYQSAWLKTHYPAAFFSGVLTHDPGMYPKRLMLDEVRRMDIPIAPLDINYSDINYRLTSDTNDPAIHTLEVRIALSAISGASSTRLNQLKRSALY
jgi:error-prone DNA polymerase